MARPAHEPVMLHVGGLEFAAFGMGQDPDAPVLFALHGLESSRESLYDRCRLLAEDGYIALALDQRNHGRRLVDARDNTDYNEHFATNFYADALGTARDVFHALDFLPARHGIARPDDQGRVRAGIFGTSMGGIAALLAMAHDPRLAVGVPFIAGGDFLTLAWHITRQHGVPDGEFARYYPTALVRIVERVDTLHRADAFAGRPLLLLNGADDDCVPPESNKKLFDALAPHYAPYPERLRFTLYDDIGHDITDAMWAEGRAWFHQWLPPAAR